MHFPSWLSSSNANCGERCVRVKLLFEKQLHNPFHIFFTTALCYVVVCNNYNLLVPNIFSRGNTFLGALDCHAESLFCKHQCLFTTHLCPFPCPGEMENCHFPYRCSWQVINVPPWSKKKVYTSRLIMNIMARWDLPLTCFCFQFVAIIHNFVGAPSIFFLSTSVKFYAESYPRFYYLVYGKS